jgi:hypothetical protein
LTSRQCFSIGGVEALAVSRLTDATGGNGGTGGTYAGEYNPSFLG